MYAKGGLAVIDEEKLLLDLKKRKRGSLEKAIDIYTAYVSVIAYNIIGDVMTKEDIEEVVSDVFVTLWRSCETLDNNKGNIRTYLSAVTRNCAKKKLKSLQTYSELNENIIALHSEPNEKIESHEEKSMLLELIRELGEPDNEIFIRHYWYDEKLSKISDVTGICQSTIKTKLRRGRIKLKDILLKRRYSNEKGI